jgi:hypothetical protein
MGTNENQLSNKSRPPHCPCGSWCGDWIDFDCGGTPKPLNLGSRISLRLIRVLRVGRTLREALACVVVLARLAKAELRRKH